MDDPVVLAEAKKIANMMKNHGVTVPRGIIDPGLYIGFLLGCAFMKKHKKYPGELG